MTRLPIGMVPWQGGDEAPDDWDGGEVWLACGEPGVGNNWKHPRQPERAQVKAWIVGYRRTAERDAA